MTDDTPIIPRAWLAVALLFFVGLLNYLDRLMLITMRLSIKEAIPMSDAQFGLLTTVFLLAYAALTPFAGFIADRFSCSRIIILSLFAWSATTWWTAHAATFPELLASRVLMAVSQAGYLPAAGALIGNYHRNATVSLATGIHLSGVMVGSSLGGLGGWLAERHGWRFPCELFGIAGVAYAAALVVLLRDAPSGRPGPAPAGARAPGARLGETFLELFRRRDFVLALLLYALLGVTSWAFVGWMPAYLGEHFRLAQGKAGLIATGFISGGSLAGMVIGGAWADRWSRARVAGRAWVGIIGLGLGVPCVLLVATTGHLGVLMAALAVCGVMRAFPDANMVPIVFHIAGQRYRATALGLLYACGTISGGITIFVGGALRDAHISIATVFCAGTVGMVAAAVLLWIIRPRAAAPG